MRIKATKKNLSTYITLCKDWTIVLSQLVILGWTISRIKS
ncbi:hypothetical protein [Caudoviricetes sp.]|nr:hypothetical protein [Caudoviricetes sp.]